LVWSGNWMLNHNFISCYHNARLMQFETAIMATLLICIIIFGLAFWRSVFDPPGLAAAFSIGFIIGVMGDVSWLLVLLIFMVMSFIATKYKFALKEAKGIQEGSRGERSASSVLATGLVPAAIAFMSSPMVGSPISTELSGVLFLSAISVAASDTLASEMGMLARHPPRLITTFKRVPAGTDGGVSPFGTAWALAGAFVVGLLGWLFLRAFSDTVPMDFWDIILITCAGFLGCNIDSILGATLERKGFIGKHFVNGASIAAGVVVSWYILTQRFFW